MSNEVKRLSMCVFVYSQQMRQVERMRTTKDATMQIELKRFPRDHYKRLDFFNFNFTSMLNKEFLILLPIDIDFLK